MHFRFNLYVVQELMTSCFYFIVQYTQYLCIWHLIQRRYATIYSFDRPYCMQDYCMYILCSSVLTAAISTYKMYCFKRSKDYQALSCVQYINVVAHKLIAMETLHSGSLKEFLDRFRDLGSESAICTQNMIFQANNYVLGCLSTYLGL